MNFEEWKQRYGLTELTEKYIGQKEAWGEKELHDTYEIQIKFKNGYEDKINFYDSRYNTERGLKSENLKELALYSHLSDIGFLESEGIDQEDEYIEVFGDVENPEPARKIYKESKRIENNFYKYFEEDNYYIMINELQEIFDF